MSHLTITIIFAACSKHSATPSPPTTNGIDPVSGGDSTRVTIQGTGFNPNPALDTVTFNGKQGTVVSATPTTLIAEVPLLAGTGVVDVAVGRTKLIAGYFTYDTTWLTTTITDSIPSPEYLVIDSTGNLYVTSYTNSIIYKITPLGSISPFAFVGNPVGLAMDRSGNLYTESDNSVVYKISPTGTVSTLTLDPGLISAMVCDNAGNLYASDFGKARIDKISPAGAISTLPTPYAATGCSGIAIGNDGTLYFAAFAPPTSDSTGFVVAATGSRPAFPVNIIYYGQNGIAVDNSNNVYVTVFNQALQDGFVLQIAPNGVQTRLLSPSIPYITGIALDQQGDIFVTAQQWNLDPRFGRIIKLSMK
jgi:hypothetical protein